MLKKHLRAWAIFLATLTLLLIDHDAQAALTIPLTVNLSETVTVTGTPRITVDVGGTTRYATYSSGSGTNVLTFTLSPQAGDVDLDGITVSSPIDLNGGSIKDTAGNDATLTFTPPNTTGIKIDYPSLSMDFVTDADGRYTLNGTAYNDLTSFLSASGGTFSRASVGTYYDSTGVLQTASSGTPRFDWDPVTHAAKGILIEESRTNLLKYSNDISNAAWVKARVLATANAALAPDNTMTATHLSDNGVSGGAYTRQAISYTANTTYTISIYAKKAELDRVRLDWYASTGWSSDGMVVFNLTTGTTSTSGTVSNYSMTPVGNGWYRCSATATFGAVSQSSNYPAVTMHINLLDSTSGFYVWGGQIEQGAFPTSLIPTTAATVTRAADSFTVPTGGWFNAQEGAFSIQGIIPSAAATVRRFATFSDGTINNTIQLANAASNTASYMEVRDSFAIQVSMSGGTFAAASYIKSAAAYKADDFALVTNGSVAGTDTAGTVPVINKLTLGSHNAGGNYIDGYLKSFRYYPARVTDTQLQLLTQ